ncbi:protein-glutamate methylesterase/protein-glutamine glutaminase [Anaerosalibacter sp. Marseille-P3206]|uniref:protein-glutamate methylesterase/protein-glutamine glutaminase n=1 Tax=Anaerosalibacter sp. Marseille-P3206 TaxID=1871005 RepID=UPI0009879083|nr:chemotaxis response regulator protein-glutamate methylesterase [Anaerosalibacter sp. Marseille-P3206]
MIKVLIVDDSALIRTIIKDIIEEDNEIKVIGIARNGKEALEKIPKLNPDVITLDVEMPIMDGITTLKEINKRYSIPVIMLSSLTTKGAEMTLKALEIGAVDFIPKPKNVFDIGSNSVRKDLIEKIKVVSKLKSIKKDIEFTETKKTKNKTIVTAKSYGKEYESIVAIGTSTGGPRALQQLIPKIPPNINATIVIVQHMPPGFTKSLANRLDTLSEVNVKEGEDGEILKRGYCYIAPGDFHMTVVETNRELKIKLDKNPPVSGLRPTVDALMESVSRLIHVKKIAAILTGMGSDGTIGINEIKKNNGFTIAEDESTCVVYGMPKSAIKSGAIDVVLPIDKIADEIINRVGG